MSFMLTECWKCSFLEADAKTPLPRKVSLADPEKRIQMVERGGGIPNSEADQMLRYGIELGRGGVWLRAANGLDCIRVTRLGQWGNPYDMKMFGRDLAMALFRNSLNGVWGPDPGKDESDEICGAACTAHIKFMARFPEIILQCGAFGASRTQSRLLLRSGRRVSR